MKLPLTVAAVALAQLALVGVAVAPQLSSRLTGEDYLLEIQPVDPIDPFRGAYVTLDYPGLQKPGDAWPSSEDDEDRGDVFVSLVERDGFWVASEWSRERPEEGPYLACDDSDRALRCGIESYFVAQDRAVRLERQLADGGVATIRIDARGRASVVAVDGGEVGDAPVGGATAPR